MKNGKYIYCFIEGNATDSGDIMGMGNHGKVYFVEYKDITVAVSDTPYTIYDPSRDNALTHERIIQHFMKSYNLIPCNFGNVFKSKNDLILFLDKAYKPLKKNLLKTRDKMEVGLRVFWKKDSFSEEIETKEIRKFRDELIQEGSEDNYILQGELGKMVEVQVRRRRDHYYNAIFKHLSQNAVDAVSNEPSNPMMILNAAFLIEKSRESEFDSIVEAVMKKYTDTLEFSYSGPWPPYNFTNIMAK